MKSLSLLIWFSQLAVSVAVPMGCSIWLSVWLYNHYRLGAWIIVAGIVLGLWWAIDGLRTSLKAMENLAKQVDEENNDKRN